MEKEIRDMLIAAGVVTENEVNEMDKLGDILKAAGIEDVEKATPRVVVPEMTDKERREQHERLQDYVGRYVKFGKEFGMIDEVLDLPYCVALGFITSNDDTWTGRVVNVEDVTIAEGEEIAKCASAALRYCSNEVVYLCNRLQRQYTMDEPYRDRMQEQIKHLDLLTNVTYMDSIRKY